MSIRAGDDQTGGDPLLVVRLQELRDWHPASVREVAVRWEQGLRALVAVAASTGVVGAPLAVERLPDATLVAVGLLLGGVVLAAGVGLTLAMSAAYGSLRLVRLPTSPLALQHARAAAAERDRLRVVRGRRFAVGAICLYAAAVVLAWASPGKDSRSMLVVDTERGVTYCGEVLDAPEGFVAVGTEAEGRVEIRMADIAAVHSGNGCAGLQE